MKKEFSTLLGLGYVAGGMDSEEKIAKGVEKYIGNPEFLHVGAAAVAWIGRHVDVAWRTRTQAMWQGMLQGLQQRRLQAPCHRQDFPLEALQWCLHVLQQLLLAH